MDIRTELKNIFARYIVDAGSNQESQMVKESDWLIEVAKFFKQHNILWRFYPVPACSYITYVITWEEQGWMHMYPVCELRESGWKSED